MGAEASCSTFFYEVKKELTILPNFYNCSNLPNDLISPIKLTISKKDKDDNSFVYILKINILDKNFNNIANLDIEFTLSGKMFPKITNSKKISQTEELIVNNTDGGLQSNFDIFMLVPSKLSNMPGSYFVRSMISAPGFQEIVFEFSIKFYFTTDMKYFDFPDRLQRNSININPININPKIFISSQLLIDYTDIGDTIFKIYDIYSYYKCEPLINNKSHIIAINNIEITKFEKSYPKIVNVLKGFGKTSKEKVIDIYRKKNIDISLYDFSLNILKYSMTTYILSRILYGKFNTKYLLRKYLSKLLNDLNKTRFSNFVTFYTDQNNDTYGYDRYFLFSY